MDTKKSDLPIRLKGMKKVCFMTAPRYESTWARNQIEAAVKRAGLNLVISQGVFYGQCMQRMLEDAIEAGVEIAITVDFDSVFTASDLFYIATKIEDPRYDAIAALQARRSMPYPLFTIGDATECTFEGEPVEVVTAHFGLTAFKLDKLQSVPKPWFWSTPDVGGRWTDGKVDDDIYFWKAWRKAGNKVFVDANCSIGHMEEMIAYFDDDGTHRHMYPNDWFEQNITIKEDDSEKEDNEVSETEATEAGQTA